MTVVKIEKLWAGFDDQYNVTILNRPRVSMKVDEYVWDIIEQNIVIPKKIMQSKRYDYLLIVALQKYSATSRFFPPSPYNGLLKNTASIEPTKLYERENFVGGEERTKWFSPETFWTNAGNKTALISAYSETVNQEITPVEYADFLFDAFAATLLHNFKKLKKKDFDEVKMLIKKDVVCSFVFPAPFSEQKYQGDTGCLRITEGDMKKVIIDIPSIEVFYKQHYPE